MLIATAAILFQEAAEEEEASGTDLILPETSELIAGIIAFTIIFLVVWRFAWPRINELLEARQEAIASQLREAERAKQEAESLREDYRQQLAGAREEAGRIVEDARQTADTMRTDLVARAQTEADQIVVRAREEAEAERDRVQAGLRREVADLSVAMADRVVRGTVDESAQRALVERYLEELGGMSN